MRRLLLCALIFAVIVPTLTTRAQTAAPTSTPLTETYRSAQFGFSFQYPAGWKIREAAERRTVTAASEADFRAIDAGGEAAGLIFTVTASTFRLAGTNRVDEFGERLRQYEKQPNAAYRTIKIGGAEGIALDILDGTLGVGGRSLMLSTGKRRLVILRGVSSITGWVKGSAQPTLDAMLASLTFFDPVSGVEPDRIGTVIWQASDARFKEFADVVAPADGATLLVTDPQQGVITLSASGAVTGIQKYDGVGSYGTLATFRDGTRYLADAANHAIWLIQPNSTTAKRLLGGSVGTARGAFGSGSPSVFSFGYQNALYILDVTDAGTRIQVFGRGGDVLTAWNISPVENGALTSDNFGYLYVVGRNTPGIIKIGADGKVVNPALGRFNLAGSPLTAIALDRFGNIYVATEDAGVIKLDSEGKLTGIIGEPYDESAPPKPGQIGKPTALALNADSTILYIADSGKYPQIVAVALSGSASASVQAATVAMGELAAGTPVEGQITNDGFVRTYTFVGQVGQVVTLTANAAPGSSLDLYIDLLDPAGQRVASNDDAKLPGALATDAQIAAYKLGASGTYIVRVTRFGRETATATGAYTLRLDR